MAQINGFDPVDSFDDVDELLALIIPDQPDDPDQALATFAGFLEARLANKGWTPDDLAQALEVRLEWVIALLNGQIPASRISDSLLTRIAHALNYEPNFLRIMLNRDFTPNAAAARPVDVTIPFFDSYQTEVEHLLAEITEYLLDRVEERYAETARSRQQHELVIKQIELIIARHRDDIRLVESLIDELRAMPGDETEKDSGPHALDIRRIIHHIRDSA
jgi:transcriptional regulator with XRE-family HTH domain